MEADDKIKYLWNPVMTQALDWTYLLQIHEDLQHPCKSQAWWLARTCNPRAMETETGSSWVLSGRPV